MTNQDKPELTLRNTTIDWIHENRKTAICRGFGYVSFSEPVSLDKGDRTSLILRKWTSSKTNKTYFFGEIENV